MVSTSSPGFQVDAVLGVFQRFAGVARNGDLFRVAAGCLRDSRRAISTCRSNTWTMVCYRPHVAIFQKPPHGILHRARRRTDVSVIEIDDVAVDGEGVTNLSPVVFVRRCFLWRFVADGARRRCHAFYGVVLKCNQCAPGCQAKEVSAMHGSPESSIFGGDGLYRQPPCIARSGDAARKSACATRGANTRVCRVRTPANALESRDDSGLERRWSWRQRSKHRAKLPSPDKQCCHHKHLNEVR